MEVEHGGGQKHGRQMRKGIIRILECREKLQNNWSGDQMNSTYWGEQVRSMSIIAENKSMETQKSKKDVKDQEVGENPNKIACC